MYFNSSRMILNTLGYVLVILSHTAQAEQLRTAAFDVTPSGGNTLATTPQTCVSLRQGRNCYIELEINWQVNAAQPVCIKNRNTDIVLECWQDSLQGAFKYDFNHTESQTFELITQHGGQSLASADVQVQWVYTNRQEKRRWRLF
ncbi:DUF3019 domain-containing protein [Pseudoalteromonas fenneropenaei]|uniref:DUF3019 domain-containing protein n=1 Tax=Pseudoalteromonas fenneropenaei TaxID=1737459 RepID=A0ABV7CI12_9GAMM